MEFVDKLQQASKIDNLQKVCGFFGCEMKRSIHMMVAAPLGESIFEPGMLELGVPGANILDSSSVGLDDIPGVFRGDKRFLDDCGPLHDSK